MAAATRRFAFAICFITIALTPAEARAQYTSVSASCPVLRDTNIRQRTPTATYDAYPKGWAHSAVEGVAGSWIEALLQFDLSACLPAGARVSAASLRLYVTNASTYPFEVYEMLRPFSAAANWKVYAAGSSAGWTSAGAMGALTDYGARVATIASAAAGPVTIPLTANVVQRWAGSSSASIVIRPTGTPGSNHAPVGLGFRSREHESGRPPVLDVVYSMPASTASSTFTIVAWNLNYGKGMTAAAAGMTCPLAGLKSNPQCQIADDPATPLDERAEERRQSAWGIGLTQRYLRSTVLGDPEVIALLLTEVNGGTCFTQADLMNVVRAAWPDAAISRSHRDNWIVARYGFVQGVTSYAHADLAPCGFKEQRTDGTLAAWPATYREGIQWGRIYVEDPDPDGDGVLLPQARTLNVFNTHWPHRGLRSDGTPFFCLSNATTTRDFMLAPAAGVSLASEPAILGGDLNTEDLVRTHDVDCEPIGGRDGFNVLRQAGLADAFTAAGAAALTPTPDGASGMIGRRATESCYRNYSHNGLYMPYKRIDYQWFKGGAADGTKLRVLGFELIGVEEFGNCVPSDHMGTKVRYAWY